MTATQPERAALTDLSLKRRTGCLARFLAATVDAPLAELPVIALIGKQPGPLFIAVAGVHGGRGVRGHRILTSPLACNIRIRG